MTTSSYSAAVMIWPVGAAPDATLLPLLVLLLLALELRLELELLLELDVFRVPVLVLEMGSEPPAAAVAAAERACSRSDGRTTTRGGCCCGSSCFGCTALRAVPPVWPWPSTPESV
jgi:hypothetical protein